MAGGEAEATIVTKVVKHLLGDAAETVAKDAGEDGLKAAAKDGVKDGAEATAKDGAEAAGKDGAEAAGKDARPPGSKCTGGDPIDLATGDVLLSQTDARLAGVLPFVVGRTHISSHRRGRLFGVSWASTLDQRLEPGLAEVVFTASDGMVLRFPSPERPEAGVRAVEGPRQWWLVMTADGGYVLTDRTTGQRSHFPPPGRHGWSDLPLAAITDPNGNRIDFDYDDDGTLAQVRHSAGHRVIVDTEPSAAGGRRVVALRLRGSGRTDDVVLMRYAYDERGDLAEVTNATGRPHRFLYDDEHRLTGWADREGHRYEYGYDGAGRAVTGEGTGGYLNTRLEFQGRRTVMTDSLGHSTTYEFNDAYQLVAVTDPLGNTVRTTWDRHHQLLTQTDALGHTTRFTYDDDGNPLSVTRPDGTESRVTYDEAMLPVRRGEPGGGEWRYAYDERGNLVQVTDPGGAVTSYRYDGRGHLVAVRDPMGAVTGIECDAAGLPVAVTGPLGGVTRYERDVFGRVVTATDGVGGVTRYGWTIDGQAAWRTRPDGATERWAYDGEGNLAEHTDPLGSAARTETGPFACPTAKTGPDGRRLEFGYDTELRVVSVTNAENLVWRYSYDAAGNLVSETDFNGRELTYTHDAAGRLTSRTNPLGETTEYTRDALGRIVERRSGDGVARFSYDDDGRLTGAANESAVLAFERDALGRMTSETCDGRTLTSVYDANGRRVARRTPSGAESVWTYDAAGLPVTVRTGGQTIRFGHDAAGREVERHIGTASSLTQRYDPAHRLIAQTIWGAPEPANADEPRLLQHRAYSFRADGSVTAIADRVSGERSFELDLTGRVTAVHARGWAERYAYDGSGNLSQATWPSASPESQDQVRSLDAAAAGDREYDGTLIRRAGRVRYEHDAQGRMVLRQRATLSSGPATWRYTWDTEDRLVGVRTPDGTSWRYRYDPLGRRVAKQRLRADGQVAEQVDFCWDGVRLAEQAHTSWSDERRDWITVGTVWEYAPGGFTPLAQTERLFARNASQQWIDHRFHAIVTDLIGTPSELVDTGGNIAWANRTSLWGGGSSRTSGDVTCPLRFPGQYYDDETGLHYNYHRHYDPLLGRYGSGDPLGLRGGLNPHAYVPNPLAWHDPLGLTPASLDQVIRELGQAGMSVTDYDVVHVPEIRDLDGSLILGRSSVDGAGNPLLGPRGRPLIEVTDHGLSPRIDPEFGPRTGKENAIETIYHEIHHIKSNQLRGHGDSEDSAEKYGRKMLDKFRGRCGA